MQIATERLTIREFWAEDEKALIEVVSDGSLHDVFGDCADCTEWMGEWLCEARALTGADDPGKAYLAYALEEKETGRLIGTARISEKTGLLTASAGNTGAEAMLRKRRKLMPGIF